MKQNLLILFTFLTLSSSSYATIVPSSNLDISATCCNNGLGFVNCDAIQQPSGNKLWVIAYSSTNATGNVCELLVFDNSYSTTTPFTKISLSTATGDATHPDVVIGDDATNPGVNYIIGVVYDKNNDVFLDRYSFTGAGSGSRSVSLINTMSVGTSLLATDDFPHIDLFADRSTFSGTSYHMLNNFVIAWSQSTNTGLMPPYPTTAREIKAAIGDLNGGPLPNHIDVSPTVPTTALDEGYISDVAAVEYTSTQTGGIERSAYVVYQTGVTTYSNNVLVKIDIDNFNNVTVNSPSVISSTMLGQISAPRIEAKNLCTPSSSYATYSVVTSELGSSGYNVIHSYNDITSNTCMLTSTSVQACPVVTGVGSQIYSGKGSSAFIGQKEFALAYYSTYTTGSGSGGDFYANLVDIGGATPGGMSNHNYYEVNHSGLNSGTPSGFGFDTSPIAISNISNTGDNLLSAWLMSYNSSYSSDVLFKWAGNTPTFKSTNVSAVSAQEVMSIFPNPANDHVQVMNITENCSYTILDVTGKLLSSGTVDQQHSVIDIQSFSNGMYFINLNKNGIETNLRFVKN